MEISGHVCHCLLLWWQNTWEKDLMEERFLLAHGFRSFNPGSLDPECSTHGEQEGETDKERRDQGQYVPSKDTSQTTYSLQLCLTSTFYQFSIMPSNYKSINLFIRSQPSRPNHLWTIGSTRWVPSPQNTSLLRRNTSYPNHGTVVASQTDLGRLGRPGFRILKSILSDSDVALMLRQPV
jgi:hypothetical protein